MAMAMGRTTTEDIVFEVLGSLRVRRGSVSLALGPVQRRVVLAVMLLHANRPIGRSRLVDCVWGSDAPVYAVNLIQKHMSGLRRAIAPVGQVNDASPMSSGLPGSRRIEQMLTWSDSGYLLSIRPGQFDLELFDGELARAESGRRSGDLTTAAHALHSALGLYRGPLCDGLVSPLLDAERDRMRERWISAVETRIEVDMAIGHCRGLVPELQELVAQYPLRERLRGLLMLALYRDDRQAEALAAYREACRYMRDELGLPAGGALQLLHHRMLNADPSLVQRLDSDIAAHGPGGHSPSEPRTLPPAQLPHGVAHFIGRSAEIDRLNGLIGKGAIGAEVRTGTRGPIVAISGTAGVGKTSLAMHWAHKVRDQFPDGQLYVNLRGFDPSGSVLPADDAIRGFLDAFGVAPEQIPVGSQPQGGLYRSLLADKRVLLVLDNARDADQVRPLIPGTSECLTIVTSRNQLAGLVATEGAEPIVLDLLDTDEARRLLVRRIGRDRVTAEANAVNDLIRLSARLPLALSILSARAASHPRFALTVLADQLRTTQDGLDAFASDDPITDVRAVFSWSYHALSPDAARLFRLLGLHPNSDVAAAAAASLAGFPMVRTKRLLAELARSHLVEESSPGRFAFHDLLRVYARELVATEDADRWSATQRMLDHFVHTARAADHLLAPHRELITSPPMAIGITQVPLDDRPQALAWFTAERSTLLSAVHLAAGEFDSRATQLAWALTTFLDYQGHWQDQAEIQHAALSIAEGVSDQSGQAHAHRSLGFAYARLNRFDDAEFHYRESLALFNKLGDNGGQARTHHALARGFDRQRQHRAALDHAERALRLYCTAGDKAGEAAARNAVGWCHAQLGDFEQALDHCGAALYLHQELGARDGQAQTWDSLGYIHHQLGHYDDAITSYRCAMGLIREFGARREEADTLSRLGDTYDAMGRREAALSVWRAGLEILDQLGHSADELRTKLDSRYQSTGST